MCCLLQQKPLANKEKTLKSLLTVLNVMCIGSYFDISECNRHVFQYNYYDVLLFSMYTIYMYMYEIWCTFTAMIELPGGSCDLYHIIS